MVGALVPLVAGLFWKRATAAGAHGVDPARPRRPGCWPRPSRPTACGRRSSSAWASRILGMVVGSLASRPARAAGLSSAPLARFAARRASSSPSTSCSSPTPRSTRSPAGAIPAARPSLSWPRPGRAMSRPSTSRRTSSAICPTACCACSRCMRALSGGAAVLLAVASGALLSLLLEAAQSFLPARIPSNVGLARQCRGRRGGRAGRVRSSRAGCCEAGRCAACARTR